MLDSKRLHGVNYAATPFCPVHGTRERGRRMSTFKIIDGPSTDRVIDSFKYAYDRTAHVQVTFIIKQGYTGGPLTGQVVGVEYESGAPGMFLMKVDFNNGFGRRTVFYNATKRTGHSI